MDKDKDVWRDWNTFNVLRHVIVYYKRHVLDINTTTSYVGGN